MGNRGLRAFWYREFGVKGGVDVEAALFLGRSPLLDAVGDAWSCAP